MVKDLSKCHCDKPGYCPIFEKEMGVSPPNWQWCQNCSQEDREEYYISNVGVGHKKTAKVLQANGADAPVVEFYHEDIDPQSDLAICVIPATQSHIELLDITRETIKKYAQKCNADYIELSGNQCEDWPMANKYRLNHVCNLYEKTLYLDCDILIKEDAPDIFKLTPNNKISCFDEAKLHKYDWWIKKEQKVIKQNTSHTTYTDLEINVPKETRMFNGGVMVIPRDLSDYYKQPSSPYPRMWCFDQHLLTLTLPEQLWHPLGDEFNLEFVDGAFWYRLPKKHFIHLNNIPKNFRFRKYLLNNIKRGFYTPVQEHLFDYHYNTAKTVLSNLSWAKASEDNFDNNKIGVMYQVGGEGGALVWLKSFIDVFKPDMSGVVCFEETNLMPWGMEAAYELYEKSDIIVLWLVGSEIPPDVPRCLHENYLNKKIILLSHSSPRVYAQKIVRDMLDIKTLACVDENSAKVFNGAHVPIFVEEERIAKKRKPIPKTVLWHHRFTKEKGLDVVLMVAKVMKDFHFIIAGNTGIHDMNDELFELKNMDNVTLHSNVKDVTPLLAKASVSLSTSKDESFGLSICESIMTGVPSVSHAVGVGKFSDIIVPFDANYSEWCAAIRLCEHNKEAKNKEKVSELFTRDNFKKSWERVLYGN